MRRTILLGLCFLSARGARAEELAPCSRADLEGVLGEGQAAALWQTMTARALRRSKCSEKLPIRVLGILEACGLSGLDRADIGVNIARAMFDAKSQTDGVCPAEKAQKAAGLEIQQSLGVLFDACHLGSLHFADRAEFIGPIPEQTSWDAIPNRHERLAGAVVFQALLDVGAARELARMIGRAISGIAKPSVIAKKAPVSEAPVPEAIPEWLKKKSGKEPDGQRAAQPRAANAGILGTLKMPPGKGLDSIFGNDQRTVFLPHQPAVLGPVEFADVQAVIDKGLADLGRCIESVNALSYDGKEVAASWTISPTGSVAGLKMELVGRRDKKLESCMSKIVGDWRFKPPYNGYWATVKAGFGLRPSTPKAE